MLRMGIGFYIRLVLLKWYQQNEHSGFLYREFLSRLGPSTPCLRLWTLGMFNLPTIPKAGHSKTSGVLPFGLGSFYRGQSSRYRAIQ